MGDLIRARLAIQSISAQIRTMVTLRRNTNVQAPEWSAIQSELWDSDSPAIGFRVGLRKADELEEIWEMNHVPGLAIDPVERSVVRSCGARARYLSERIETAFEDRSEEYQRPETLADSEQEQVKAMKGLHFSHCERADHPEEFKNWTGGCIHAVFVENGYEIEESSECEYVCQLFTAMAKFEAVEAVHKDNYSLYPREALLFELDMRGYVYFKDESVQGLAELLHDGDRLAKVGYTRNLDWTDEVEFVG